MTITALFHAASEGGYVCQIKEIPEVMSQGETLQEARDNLMDALALVLDYRQ